MKTTSSDFQQNVGRYLDASATEPVIITKHGRYHTVLLSAALFETLVRARSATHGGELDEATLQAIAAATAAFEKR